MDPNHRGNLEFVRLCIGGRSTGAREVRPGARFGRGCRIVWVGKCKDTMRHGGTGDMEGLAKRQVISRFEGMREISDKAQTERALALCRFVGMPGYGPGAGSFFPRTWLLPEQRAELEDHVRERRLRAAAKGRAAPTVIVKPSGGS